MKYAILLLAGMWSGCSTTRPPAQPIEDMRTFQAPMDRTWGALVSTVAEMGLEVESVDKASGLLTTKPHPFLGVDAPENEVSSIDAYCYGPSIMTQVLGGGWKVARYKLNILATPGPGTTKVKVVNVCDGTSGAGIAYKLTSVGAIERRVFEGIAQRL